MGTEGISVVTLRVEDVRLSNGPMQAAQQTFKAGVRLAVALMKAMETKIEFRRMNPDDNERVRQFLSEIGWRERVSDLGKFKKMLENTTRTVVAVDGSRIVGFARAVCDEVSNGYISMVGVAADMRGQGIGGELVRQLVRKDAGITWVLRAGHGSNGFWEKMGFKPSEVAMERVRT